VIVAVVGVLVEGEVIVEMKKDKKKEQGARRQQLMVLHLQKDLRMPSSSQPR